MSLAPPRPARAAVALALLAALLVLPRAAPAQSFDPAALAPGAPEFEAATARLDARLSAARAIGLATSLAQAAFTQLPAGDCADAARLELGWRAERLGAAWREATQAAVAEADRVRRIRAAPTFSPLLSPARAAAVDATQAAVDLQRAAVLEAGAWQATFARPALAACPAPALAPREGFGPVAIAARGDPKLPVAVLAMGDGYVCPPGVRAEEAVVLLDAGEACWSASVTCGCAPRPVLPGAVLGPSWEATAAP